VCFDLNRRNFCLLAVPAAICSAAQSSDSKEKKEDPKTPPPPVYTPGGDVKAPKLTHYVEPEFSPSSKEAYVEGVVKISTVVTTDGLPTELVVVHGLNTEEDSTALKAVGQWRFDPGTKSGKPVYVKVTLEIEFHLL
jgi:TonB family protein